MTGSGTTAAFLGFLSSSTKYVVSLDRITSTTDNDCHGDGEGFPTADDVERGAKLSCDDVPPAPPHPPARR